MSSKTEPTATVTCDHQGAWAGMSTTGPKTSAEIAIVALAAAHGNTSQLIVQLPWLCGKSRRSLVEQLASITSALIEVAAPEQKP